MTEDMILKLSNEFKKLKLKYKKLQKANFLNKQKLLAVETYLNNTLNSFDGGCKSGFYRYDEEGYDRDSVRAAMASDLLNVLKGVK